MAELFSEYFIAGMTKHLRVFSAATRCSSAGSANLAPCLTCRVPHTDRCVGAMKTSQRLISLCYYFPLYRLRFGVLMQSASTSWINFEERHEVVGC